MFLLQRDKNNEKSPEPRRAVQRSKQSWISDRIVNI